MASVTVRATSPWTNPKRNSASISNKEEQSQNSDSKSNYSDLSSFPPLPTQAKVTLASDQCSYSSTLPSNPNIQDNITISASSILHLSFDQDHACFATGTDQGLGLYNYEPFGMRTPVPLRGFAHIGIVEMFECNFFALVGGGSNTKFPPDKVMIWDDFQKKITGTISCKSDVRAVRLLRDYIIIVLKQKIQIHEFGSWKILREFETTENPKGICAVSQVSQVSGGFMLVCPGLQKGQVRVQNYVTTKGKPEIISAHGSEIACLALSRDGNLVATASTKGTLVRIYNTSDRSVLQEVRRGADKANIYSLTFSPTSQWLAVLSDKGTVHLFAVKFNSIMLEMLENENLQSVSDLNISAPLSRSSLSFMKGVLPRYFSSEWSVAQFCLPENIKYIVGFGHEKNTIVIVGMDGSFHRCQFDPSKGGKMIQLQFCNFLSPKKTF